MNTSGFVALACIGFVAWAWHGITEHHAHLRLLRVFRKDTAVPRDSAYTPWHRAGHWKRMAAIVAMGLLGFLIGYGWQISPLATGSALIFVSVPAAGLIVLRRGGSDLAFRPSRQRVRIEEGET